MRCPFCDAHGARSDVHAHLVAEHADRVRTWEDDHGRRRYEIACPQCGAAHAQRVKPRSHDPAFLEQFAAEIRLVAFDMLLCHLEAEHDAAPAPAAAAEVPGPLPRSGPGGGRGRPGDGAVPLPPGMPRPTPHPLERRPVEVRTYDPAHKER